MYVSKICLDHVLERRLTTAIPLPDGTEFPVTGAFAELAAWAQALIRVEAMVLGASPAVKGVEAAVAALLAALKTDATNPITQAYQRLLADGTVPTSLVVTYWTKPLEFVPCQLTRSEVHAQLLGPSDLHAQPLEVYLAVWALAHAINATPCQPENPDEQS